VEHKLITGTGAEIWLPFARSRIKALRATGLAYASQQFEIEGCSVKVRIEPEQEYISLSGGSPMILSGLIRVGEIVELPAEPGIPPEKVLRDYKPTQQAYEYPLKKNPSKSPALFNDEPKLAPADPDADKQYEDLSPSMFSGLMAKAIQVIMGQGLGVKYDYKFLRCHGIVKAVDKKLWLIEISKVNGVIAMRLPLAFKGEFTSSKQDVLKQCGELFKGVPSGTTFPLGAKLTDALTAGTVIRLATVESMDPFFSKHAYMPTMGWSFNDTGTEAHNTCYRHGMVDDAHRFGCHYKLNIEIGEIDKEREPGDPLAEGTATLTLVEEGPLLRNLGETMGFAFSSKEAPYIVPLPAALGFDGFVAPSPANPSDPQGGYSTAVFVCFIEGAFDVVRVVFQPDFIENTGPDNVTHPPGGTRTEIEQRGSRYMASAKFPMPRDVVRYTETRTFNFVSQTAVTRGIGGGSDVYTTYTDTIYQSTLARGATYGIAPHDSRDCYVAYCQSENEFELTGSGRQTYYSLSPFDYLGDEMPPPPADFGSSSTRQISSVVDELTVFGRPGILATPANSSSVSPTQRGFYWADPSNSQLQFPGFNAGYAVRYSMLGASKHLLHSRQLWAENYTLVGSTFAGETSPSDHLYNFIGYTE
jgi:hypothetical protein